LGSHNGINGVDNSIFTAAQQFGRAVLDGQNAFF
jgi:hypothetical protein